jgi:DNA-binding MarR family transcriptional regulator
VSAELERSLTEVARAILRLEVPRGALAEGESVDRAGYWLMVHLSDRPPVRLSELADSVELDLSTVSRQMRDLVASGLVAKRPDPVDGRASLLTLSARGRSVLEAVSEARRQALAEAVGEWTDGQRNALTTGLARLEAGLHQARTHPDRAGSR